MYLINIHLQAQDVLWQWYSPPDSTYQVSIPAGEMTFSTDTISTAIGSLIYHKVMNKNDVNGRKIYTVISESTYPTGSLHSDSSSLLSDFWKTTVEQSTKNLGGKLIYKSDVRVGKWPAYKWKINFGEDKRMDNLGIFIENKFYLLQFSSLNTIKFTDIKERFFRSFSFQE